MNELEQLQRDIRALYRRIQDLERLVQQLLQGRR